MRLSFQKWALSLLASSVFFVACGNKATEQPTTGTKPGTEAVAANPTEQSAASASAADEGAIREFLYSTSGTYGWKAQGDPITLDFFKDGRLHIQGEDGEASMWQGKWSLKGDQLTMERADLNKTLTAAVKIEGDKLVLDGKAYNRNK